MSGVQKIFHALSKTFDSLIHYDTELLGKLSSGASINATRGFPYITKYDDGTVPHFTYEKRLDEMLEAALLNLGARGN